MHPNRLPRMNTRNVRAAIAIGATTLHALAQIFGVAPDDRSLRAIVAAMRASGRLSVSPGDLHIMSLTGGTR